MVTISPDLNARYQVAMGSVPIYRRLLGDAEKAMGEAEEAFLLVSIAEESDVIVITTPCANISFGNLDRVKNARQAMKDIVERRRTAFLATKARLKLAEDELAEVLAEIKAVGK